MKKMKTSLRGLVPYNTGSWKRKADGEEESKSATALGLVTSSTLNKGEKKPKLAEGEGGVEGDGVDVIEDEISEWEHSFWSQSSDDDRPYSDDEDGTETFEDYLWEQGVNLDYCDQDMLADYRSRYNFRRLFCIAHQEKPDKFAIQNKIKFELSVLVNRMSDVTHESSADNVFEKLKKKGVLEKLKKECHIREMPKNFAMPWIDGAISRRLDFHELDLEFKIVKELVTMVPCIKVDADYEEVVKFLRRAGDLGIDFSDDHVENAMIKFEDILHVEGWRWYHPVIRKERMKWILEKIERECKKARRQLIQNWNKDAPERFVEYIKEKEEEIKSSKEYLDALKVVQLHQEFHEHVSSCDFITNDMKVSELMKDKRVVEIRFEGLDRKLIKASLKGMLHLLKANYEFRIFEAWMQDLVEDKVTKGRSRMDETLDIIRVDHPNFPHLSSNWTFTNLERLPHDWTVDQMQDELSSFYELLRKVQDLTNCQVSYDYLIEGILDYLRFCSWYEKNPENFLELHDGQRYSCIPQLPGSMKKAWDEAFYDHSDYKTVYEDVSTLIC